MSAEGDGGEKAQGGDEFSEELSCAVAGMVEAERTGRLNIRWAVAAPVIAPEIWARM